MKTFIRILKYVKSYWIYLVGSITCIFFFTIFSSATVISAMPFLGAIFNPEPSTITPQGSENNSAMEPTIPKAIAEKRKVLEQKLYKIFLGDNKDKALLRLCVIITLLILLKSVFGYFQAYLMAHVEQGIIKDLRNDLFRQLSRLSLDFFHHTKTGELISRITNDVNLLNGGVSASFVTLIKNPLLIVAYIIIAFYISWKLTFVALVILPFSLIIISAIAGTIVVIVVIVYIAKVRQRT